MMIRISKEVAPPSFTGTQDYGTFEQLEVVQDHLVLVAGSRREAD